MNRTQVVDCLRVETVKAGGVRAWASRADFAESYVRRVLALDVAPSVRLLTALGLKRVERYEVA